MLGLGGCQSVSAQQRFERSGPGEQVVEAVGGRQHCRVESLVLAAK